MTTRTRTALAALVAAAALTGCSTAPTTADLAAAASDRLSQTTEDCRRTAADDFPTFRNDPARELAQEGCRRVTCDDLANWTNAWTAQARDRAQGVAARDWLNTRWETAGCREVAARVQASDQ